MNKQIVVLVIVLAVAALAFWYGTREVEAPTFETGLLLEETAWSWQYTELQSGEVVEAPTGDHFVLTLDGEGHLGSSSDCNTIGGSYVVDGEVLSIGQLVMTKMYCEGSMEGAYVEHLRLVNSYVINDDTLRLNLNRDYGVMVFKSK